MKPSHEPEIVFFEVDPKKNAMTRIGYTSLESDGKIVVYVGPDGPLDPKYSARWHEYLAKKKAAEPANE